MGNSSALLIILDPKRFQDCVRDRISHGKKPRPTALLMVPPLFVLAGCVFPDVQKIGPLLRRRSSAWSLTILTAKTKLIYTAFTTVGTMQEK